MFPKGHKDEPELKLDYRFSVACLCHPTIESAMYCGNGCENMSNQNRSWRWAYQKIRSYHVSRLRAIYRATRFWLLGDTGSFTSHGGFRKSRIRS